MIFEQPFYDNCCDKLSLILTFCFYFFSFYCFGFCVDTNISLYILVVPQVTLKSDYSNNILLLKIDE